MAVEHVQCPSCGAPIALEGRQAAAQCAYCGAHLRITQGASGHPLAILDDIKVDSSILAMNVVRGRLQEELAALQKKREHVLIEADSQKLREVPGCVTVFAVIGILDALILLPIGLSIEDPSMTLAGGCCFAVVIGIFAYADWRRKKIDRQTQAQIAPIDKEIRRVQAELARIEGQLDQLAKKLAQ